MIEVNKTQGYLQLLNEKNFIKNTMGTMISRFGDGVDTIAMAILIYKITGSALLVATLYAVNGIPNLIFGMISGVVCNYMSDKKIMVLCDIGRGICVTVLATLFMLGRLHISYLFIITFLNSSFESFRAPASTSIIPKLLPKEKLDYGVAASSNGSRITELFGLAIAPLLIVTLGLGNTIIIDAVTFFICAFVISIIKFKCQIDRSKTLTVKRYFIDLKEGFAYVKTDGLILNLVIFAAVVNALLVPLNALQAPYVDQVIHMGNEALSVISIALVLGMIVTTMFVPKIKEKLGNKNLFLLGGIIVGLTYVIMTLIGQAPKILILPLLAVDVFLVGCGAIFLNFPLQVTMLKKVSGEYLPRVAAIFNAVALCATPLMSSIVGVVSSFIPLELVFISFGILVVILFALQIFNKSIKEINNY